MEYFSNCLVCGKMIRAYTTYPTEEEVIVYRNGEAFTTKKRTIKAVCADNHEVYIG